MKIAFFDLKEICDRNRPFIRENFEDVLIFKESLGKRHLKKIAKCEVVVCFISSKIDKLVLSKLANLKLIVTMSTGYDHIDIEECKKRKITVCNVPFYGDCTVAEHTFALILSLSRKIVDSVKKVHMGKFEDKNLEGFDLKGKTLGLLGTGHIASNVARIAKGFEMNISGYDAFPNQGLVSEYGLKYVDFNFLLRNSDIVSLHLPLNEKTKHIINSKSIKNMKKTAFIINTARGALIDTGDLLKALKSKKIAGAGLDVLEEEDCLRSENVLHSDKCNLKILLENKALINLDNVVVTPHIAFDSKEAKERILRTAISNIKAFIEGRKENVVC